MKRRRRFNIPARIMLIICTIICLALIIVSFKYQEQMNPVKTSVGNIIKPMQSGINSIGSSIYSVFDMFKSKKDLLDENAELKKELSDVKNENLSAYRRQERAFKP